MSIFINVIAAIAISIPLTGFSQQIEPPLHMHQQILRHNSTRHKSNLGVKVLRPYAEYERAGYLIFSSGYNHNSRHIKHTLAKELPEHMKLIVFTPSKTEAKTIRRDFQPHVGNRLIILKTDSSGFWARDGVPIPVYNNDYKLTVVDAKYFYAFDSDQIFADQFNAELVSHDYYFEGGNFVNDAYGNCMIVDNWRVKPMGKDIFEKFYGCKRVERFAHISGIGHIDEVIKLLDDQHVLTDHDEYVNRLTKLGYTVTKLPKAKNKYETYVNSLILGSKVFMPAFGRSDDAKAQAVYESFGFEVFALDSYKLSNYGHGSIHCITMTYPDVPLTKVVRSFNATIL